LTTNASVPWPPALVGTPAVSVIESAIERRRLSHSLLLAGDDPEVLAAAGLALADRLLNRGSKEPAPYPPDRHPDCFLIRPSGKSRSISASAIRELIGQINVSSSVSPYKVVILHDADRMNAAAANILLKTLEEPPANTTILLLTSKPHALIPTIRSRVLHFRFPGMTASVPAEGWTEWISDYRLWLELLGHGMAPGKSASEGLFTLYGLIARFGTMLDKAAAQETTRRKALLPEGLEDDEIAAVEVEISVGLRLRMFAGIEEATREHALKLLAAGDSEARRPLIASTDALERAAGLLRVNLNESAALEDFLLASLRIWTRR
jgi:DNA polymerase-3 subunit delta'